MEPGAQRNEIKNALIRAVEQLGWIVEHSSIVLNLPPSQEYGDYATSLPLSLSKQLRRKPTDIAEDLKKAVSPFLNPICNEIKVSPPGYLNFKTSNEHLLKTLFFIMEAGSSWGSVGQPGKPKKVIVEYSSPNIAKLMHVGHLRNTIIGHALDNLHRHLGYDVISDNHLGDWGTQFGKLLVAYRLWFNQEKHPVLTVEKLEELYIRFSKEAKDKPELMDQARSETVKLQSGDKEARQLWTMFYETSMKEFNRMYELLGIRFDHVKGESFYEPMLPSVVQDALNKKVAIKSQGAVIIPLDEFNLPPYMIMKSDGGYLYSTTDLATIKWREENLRPDLVLYVVADQQELHFKQLFVAAKKMGYSGKGELIHISYGLVLGEDGKKMSTREGETVNARQLVDKSVALARKVIEEKSAALPPAEKDATAANIGVSALIYNDLSHERSSAIRFNWNTMMNLKGSSAPYLLYTYVRIQGILRKTKTDAGDDAPVAEDKNDAPLEPEERRLLAVLVRFPETLEDAAAALQMRILIDYLNDLAAAFHGFYDKVPVLNALSPLRAFRFTLLRATALTMLRGFSILGMKPVERM